MSEGGEEPRAGEALGADGGLVLVAVESTLTRTLLWTGLRHSGFAAAVVRSAAEARSVLESRGGGGVLLVDGVRLVAEGAAWRGLAAREPPVALVALRVASGSTFASDWVAELGCECLDDPVDLARVLELVRRLAPGRRSPLDERGSRRPPREDSARGG